VIPAFEHFYRNHKKAHTTTVTFIFVGLCLSLLYAAIMTAESDGADCDAASNGKLLLKMPHILEVLAKSIDIQKRQSALQLAIAGFGSNRADGDHQAEQTNATITSALTLVLRCLQREYYYCSSGVQATKDASRNIVNLYLQLLTVMFQRSKAPVVVQTFEKIGTDLLSLLVAVLCDKIVAPNGSIVIALFDQLAEMHDLSLSRVDQNETLVGLLQRVIRGEYPPSCCPCRIGLQLLNAWADRQESKEFLLVRPGFLDDVLAIAQKKSTAKDGKTMLNIALFLSKAAYEAHRKPELVRKKGFLGTIFILLNEGESNDTRLDTRRTAIVTLSQLGTEATCRVPICTHDRGSILKVLMKAMEVPELCAVANHAMLRLISQDTTSYILKKVPAIIDRLVQYGLSTSTDGHYSEAPALAAQALKRISSFEAARNKVNPTLIDGLTFLLGAKNSAVQFWAAKGIREAVQSSTGRFFMARDYQNLTILIQLAKDDTNIAIKSFATDALVLLALDDVNAKRLASSPEVLEIFVKNAQVVDKLSPPGCSSIEALLSLASHKSADKKRVAKTFDLVSTLSEFGVSQDGSRDQALKNAALHCVIMLAPFM